MEPQEFGRQLGELRTIITDGIAYFSAWRGLMVEDVDSAHALNRYRGLFLSARNALLWMTLMQFAKVFDHDSRAVSIRNLLAEAVKDREHLTPYATEKDLEQIQQRIKVSGSLLEKLKQFRDQRLAHHDSIVSDNVSIPYEDFTRFVEEVKLMHNSLARGHDRSVTAFDRIAIDAGSHTSEVVRIMCEERDRAIQRARETEKK